MKLKNKISVLNEYGVHDKKSKLNKLDKNIDQKYLDCIESGVTIEELDKMQKDGLPILKYSTQITIHGKFPSISNNYIYGYKNIFQNKNKSIGVKYNAIDEEKRRRIYDKVKIVGWKYKRNSSDVLFSLMKVANDRDEALLLINDLKSISNNIDNSLFYGGKYLYYGEYFGRIYIFLDLNIGAIYEDNIDEIVAQMGATDDAINTELDKIEKERIERDNYWKQKELESEKKRESEMDRCKGELDYLNSRLKKVVKCQSEGVYITPKFNYNDEMEFVLSKIYLPKGKKKLRLARRVFKKAHEAANYHIEPSYSDNIFNGKITGYKLP